MRALVRSLWPVVTRSPWWRWPAAVRWGLSALPGRLNRAFIDRLSRDAELLRTVRLPAEPRPALGFIVLAAPSYVLEHHPDPRVARALDKLFDVGAEVTDEDYEVVRSFWLTHRDSIQRVIDTRRCQTNDVRRTVALAPAFCAGWHQLGADRPLACIEVGCSAGLNLGWDRYRYRLGAETHLGPPDSPLLIECELTGGPPAVDGWPSVSRRVGVDLNPLRLDDPDDVAWIIGQLPRDGLVGLTRAAIEIARALRIEVHPGDGIARLPELVASVPADEIPCVFHSIVTYQLPPRRRRDLADTIARLGATRDLVYVRLENASSRRRGIPELALTVFRGGAREDQVLGYFPFLSPGCRLEWLAS